MPHLRFGYLICTENFQSIHHEGICLWTDTYRSSSTTSVLVEYIQLPLTHWCDLPMCRALSIWYRFSPTRSRVSKSEVVVDMDHSPSLPMRPFHQFVSHGLEPAVPPDVNHHPPWLLKFPSVVPYQTWLIPPWIVPPAHAWTHVSQRPYEIFTDGSKSQDCVEWTAISPASSFQRALPSTACV